MQANYGGVHIRVADPISVKSYLMDSKIKEMRRLNSSLAHSVLFACNQVMVIEHRCWAQLLTPVG